MRVWVGVFVLLCLCARARVSRRVCACVRACSRFVEGRAGSFGPAGRRNSASQLVMCTFLPLVFCRVYVFSGVDLLF